MHVLVRLGIIPLACVPAIAQLRSKPLPPSRPPILERLQRMSPNDRERALKSLPPDRARAVKKGLDRLDHMAPDDRERLNEQYEWFQQLPPEKQDAMRNAFRRYRELPEARQEAVIDEFHRLRDLPDGDRRSRMKEPEFRSSFNSEERKLLDEMTSSVPE